MNCGWGACMLFVPASQAVCAQPACPPARLPACLPPNMPGSDPATLPPPTPAGQGVHSHSQWLHSSIVSSLWLLGDQRWAVDGGFGCFCIGHLTLLKPLIGVGLAPIPGGLALPSALSRQRPAINQHVRPRQLPSGRCTMPAHVGRILAGQRQARAKAAAASESGCRWPPGSSGPPSMRQRNRLRLSTGGLAGLPAVLPMSPKRPLAGWQCSRAAGACRHSLP